MLKHVATPRALSCNLFLELRKVPPFLHEKYVKDVMIMPLLGKIGERILRLILLSESDISVFGLVVSFLDIILVRGINLVLLQVRGGGGRVGGVGFN